jgi:hypothetical protein
MFRDFNATGGTGGQVVTAVAVNTAFDIPPYGDVVAASQEKTLAANGAVVFHNLSNLVFNTVGGLVNFTYSAETDLQVAVLKVA